jgi:hypothetical protein
LDFATNLRRTTMGGLLLLAALILFVAPASAHSYGHGHHGHAGAAARSSAPGAASSSLGEHAPLPFAAMTFVSAADGSSEPCEAPGHSGMDHSGCCASSHCPTAHSGLPIVQAAIFVPARTIILPMASGLVDGISAGPGDRPPRIS